MERWHRCSRWTSKRIPCPYGGLELEELPERDRTKEPALVQDKVLPLQQQAQAAVEAPVKAEAKATAGAAVAQVDSPLHSLIEDAVSVKERALPGAGPVPLWGDAPAIQLAKTWTTPVLEHGMADVIYADPRGPGGISTLPLVAIRQGRGAPPTGPAEPLLQEPQRVAVRPSSGETPVRKTLGTGQYPLMEAQLAAAMAGRTPPVPKVTAIEREAPQSIEQDAWNIQNQVAVVAGAIAVASITAPSINPAKVAGHMEKFITKDLVTDSTVKTKDTRNLWRNREAPRVKQGGGGPAGGSAGRRGRKGGAFQTRTIWEGGVGARQPKVREWEDELKRVSQDSSGFAGILG